MLIYRRINADAIAGFDLLAARHDALLAVSRDIMSLHVPMSDEERKWLDDDYAQTADTLPLDLGLLAALVRDAFGVTAFALSLHLRHGVVTRVVFASGTGMTNYTEVEASNATAWRWTRRHGTFHREPPTTFTTALLAAIAPVIVAADRCTVSNDRRSTKL